MKIMRKEQERKEKECKPLTDEEYKEHQEKKARKEKKVKGFFDAVWEAVTFFT